MLLQNRSLEVNPAFKVVYVRRRMGRDSSVDIATRYGLDGPGIESWWRRGFLHPSRPALGSNPASYTTGTGSFLAVKRTGHGADHPPHLAPRLKKE